MSRLLAVLTLGAVVAWMLHRRREPVMSADHAAYLDRVFAWRDLERVDSV